MIFLACDLLKRQVKVELERSLPIVEISSNFIGCRYIIDKKFTPNVTFKKN